MTTTPPSGSIRRTLAILRALAGGPLSLGQVSAATGLPKPTVLRTLRICGDEGFVREVDGSWRLTTLLWRLGVGAVDLQEVSDSVPNVLADLTRSTGETAVFAVYERGHIVYANEVESPNPVRAHVRIGHQVSALRAATGISIVAARGDDALREALAAGDFELHDDDLDAWRVRLARVAADGYALNTDGMWPNMWGLAAAVVDRNGRAVAAVGLAAPLDRRPHDESDIAGQVIRAAQRLSASDPADRTSSGSGQVER